MRPMLRLAQCAAIAVIAASTPAKAQWPPEAYPGPLNASEQLDRLSADLEASFSGALESYDRQIDERPYDIALRVERCRFIDDFSYQHEYELWIDAVFELAAACAAELEREWPRHPEVLLRGFEYLYGESLLEAALPYDYPPNRPHWTEAQLARLYEMLAVAADVTGNPDAGAFAQRAVELDAAASVRVIAAERLLADGKPEQALAILHSPLAPRNPADDPWNALREMALLASIGERARAVALYRQLKATADYYDSSTAARALRDAGEIGLARVEFAAAAERASYDTYPLYEWFDFELAFGTGAEALAAYERWRAMGWGADPLGANRLALFFKDPSLPLAPRDLLGLVGLLMALLFAGLLALAAVAPVHYRGAVLRARGLRSVDSSGWRLRHAWYALFAMGAASILAVLGLGAIMIAPLTEPEWLNVAGNEQLARYFLVDAFVFMGLLLPVCRVGAGAERSWVSISWSLPKCIVIALAAAIVFRLPFFAYRLFEPDFVEELIASSAVWELVLAVRERYGAFVAIWLVAAVAPVVEEITFRGVLLRSFAKNLSFGWANALQAALFALMHFDLQAAPLLFLVGIVAGVLAKRSGGLLAPMVLHAVFNVIVGTYVLSLV